MRTHAHTRAYLFVHTHTHTHTHIANAHENGGGGHQPGDTRSYKHTHARTCTPLYTHTAITHTLAHAHMHTHTHTLTQGVVGASSLVMMSTSQGSDNVRGALGQWDPHREVCVVRGEGGRGGMHIFVGVWGSAYNCDCMRVLMCMCCNA